MGPPIYVIDLRAAPEKGPVADWLNRPLWQRSQDVDMKCTPAERYDVFFFIDTITRSRPNPLALERFRNMR